MTNRKNQLQKLANTAAHYFLDIGFCELINHPDIRKEYNILSEDEEQWVLNERNRQIQLIKDNVKQTIEKTLKTIGDIETINHLNLRSRFYPYIGKEFRALISAVRK